VRALDCFVNLSFLSKRIALHPSSHPRPLLTPHPPPLPPKPKYKSKNQSQIPQPRTLLMYNTLYAFACTEHPNAFAPNDNVPPLPHKPKSKPENQSQIPQPPSYYYTTHYTPPHAKSIRSLSMFNKNWSSAIQNPTDIQHSWNG